MGWCNVTYKENAAAATQPLSKLFWDFLLRLYLPFCIWINQLYRRSLITVKVWNNRNLLILKGRCRVHFGISTFNMRAAACLLASCDANKWRYLIKNCFLHFIFVVFQQLLVINVDNKYGLVVLNVSSILCLRKTRVFNVLFFFWTTFVIVFDISSVLFMWKTRILTFSILTFGTTIKYLCSIFQISESLAEVQPSIIQNKFMTSPSDQNTKCRAR